MNDEGNILGTQLHEQRLQPDCATDGPQDGNYNEVYEKPESFQNISITGNGTILQTDPNSDWQLTSLFPTPPVDEGVFQKDDDSSQFAYTFQVNFSDVGILQKYLFVVFTKAEEVDPIPTGVWLGMSSGETPDCLKGYTAYRPAKPQA